MVVKYPVNVRNLYPNVSFPVDWKGGVIENSEYVYVHPTPPPDVLYTQRLEPSDPELIDGVWYQTYKIIESESEFISYYISERWSTIREERNALLAASDWTQLPNGPLDATQVAAWASYRQSLRDITNQPNPFSIVWPVSPAPA